MFKELKTAILTFLILTIITGIFYPLFITGVSKVFFRSQADGSLIYRNGKPVGSSLIGQSFDDPKYFWPRPSATSPASFNASSSSGSNLGPLNPALTDAIKNRVKAYKAADPNNTSPVPIDLVTSSASGLDPHISLAGAYYQAPRVARLRNLPLDTVRAIILQHTNKRFLAVLGEPVVNVLELNLSLDEYKK
ncbi:MAG: potassium-transporting ATPase subunit KdpC [Sedimentisphaerales bacterium]|jgi:K+-transporting ATPase ATPase C chain